MSLTTSRKKKLEELQDRESRQYFYEEHIESGLPIQIRELRKKRKLKQNELAKLAEVDQSNISNWENPNYEYKPQIGTLQKLANAFDVPLIVRFGSWEELLEWDDTLAADKVAPESFEEYVERVEKESEPSPTLTLVRNNQEGQPTLQFQRADLYLVAKEENPITGNTETAAISVKVAGSAR